MNHRHVHLANEMFCQKFENKFEIRSSTLIETTNRNAVMEASRRVNNLYLRGPHGNERNINNDNREIAVRVITL